MKADTNSEHAIWNKEISDFKTAVYFFLAYFRAYPQCSTAELLVYLILAFPQWGKFMYLSLRQEISQQQHCAFSTTSHWQDPVWEDQPTYHHRKELHGPWAHLTETQKTSFIKASW